MLEVVVADGIILARSTRDMTDILADPSGHTILQKKADIQLFTDTLCAKGRVKTKLKPTSRFYSGRNYYRQGLEPTCLPWTLMNACLVRGISPDSGFAAEVINYANAVDNPKAKKGEKFTDASEILKDYPEAGFNIEEIVLNSAFKPLEGELEGLIDRAWSYVGGEYDYVNGTEILVARGLQQSLLQGRLPFNRGSQIRENATSIVELIEEGSVLLASVAYHKYIGAPYSYPQEYHAICIPGYRVTEGSFLDVQVIDSGRGIFWMSSEHLYNCLSLPAWKMV